MLTLHLLVSSADNLNANSLDPDQARQKVWSICKLFGIGIPNFFPPKSRFWKKSADDKKACKIAQ